jgi:hypothetical protein
MNSPKTERVERLDASHDTSSFKCKEPYVEAFLANRALALQDSNACSVYLVINNKTNEIWGFFTLSNASLHKSVLSNQQAKRYGFDPIPGLLIGQLARDNIRSPKGFGETVLREAFNEALKRNEWQILCLDPASDESRIWFMRHGFQETKPDTQSRPSDQTPIKHLKLFLKRTTIASAETEAKKRHETRPSI